MNIEMTIKKDIEKILNSKTSVNKAEAILYYLTNECGVPLVISGWIDDDDNTYRKLISHNPEITSYLNEISLIKLPKDRIIQ